MRDINIADLQKLADKQADNFATLKIDLDRIMAFLQLLLNFETYRIAEKFGIPFDSAQRQINQTLSKIFADINQASLESAKLFAEFQKQKRDR